MLPLIVPRRFSSALLVSAALGAWLSAGLAHAQSPAAQPATAEPAAQPPAPSPRSDTPAAAPASGAPTGRVRVLSNRPGTRVWLSGREVGVAPLDVEVPAQSYQFRLEAPGHRPWTGELLVPARMRLPLRATLMPAPPRSWAWTALGTSVATGALGVALGVLSNSTLASLQADRMRGWTDNRDPRLDRGSALSIGADTALVTSALVLALAIYFFVEGPGERSTARAGRARPLEQAPAPAEAQ